jgi:hypothetical protein
MPITLNDKPFSRQCPAPPTHYDPALQLSKFETEEGCLRWRNERADMLRIGKNNNPGLADKLDSCSMHRPCGSSACPVCWCWFRRWTTGAFMGLLDDIGWSMGLGYAVTAIPGWAAREPGGLARFNISQAIGRLRTTLARSSCCNTLVVGGWDFSFNSHSANQWSPEWQPHLYLLFPMARDKEELKAALASTFPASDRNPRPLKIQQLNNPMKAITYAFKGVFNPRTSYIDNDGRRNTRTNHRLPGPIERELLTYLDQLGVTGRMFLRNVRRRACRLVAHQKNGSKSAAD